MRRPSDVSLFSRGFLAAGAVVLTMAIAASLGLAFGDEAARTLPDLKLTPGVARPELTKDQICTTKWGKDQRAVTAAMKRRVFDEYGYPKGNKDPRCACEIDHLISRELGGADDVKNLWVQSYSGAWNARMKDRLENKLHVEMCAGKITLEDARAEIVTNWQKAFVKRFGAPP